MTRARQTLALARVEQLPPRHDAARSNVVRESDAPAYSGRSHPLPHGLPANGSVLRRAAGGVPPDAPEHARLYRRPRLREINLGFAGRHHASHPVHRTIAALSPGDPLEVRVVELRRWELLNRSGKVVGRLAAGFEPPPAVRCCSATVLAIVAWSREASEVAYRNSLKLDNWEVVVPEAGVRAGCVIPVVCEQSWLFPCHERDDLCVLSARFGDLVQLPLWRSPGSLSMQPMIKGARRRRSAPGNIQ